MSKIRIYELARELGVDNRIVILKANELGFSGKSSHSHSLEADEADNIRRALIRRAMDKVENGNNGASITKNMSPQPKPETVNTKLENNILEKRKGNVILRRKNVSQLPGDAPAMDETKVNENSSVNTYSVKTGNSTDNNNSADSRFEQSKSLETLHNTLQNNSSVGEQLQSENYSGSISEINTETNNSVRSSNLPKPSLESLTSDTLDLKESVTSKESDPLFTVSEKNVDTNFRNLDPEEVNDDTLENGFQEIEQVYSDSTLNSISKNNTDFTQSLPEAVTESDSDSEDDIINLRADQEKDTIIEHDLNAVIVDSDSETKQNKSNVADNKKEDIGTGTGKPGIYEKERINELAMQHGNKNTGEAGSKLRDSRGYQSPTYKPSTNRGGYFRTQDVKSTSGISAEGVDETQFFGLSSQVQSTEDFLSKKGGGPKVLGKIELAVKRPLKTIEVKKSASQTSTGQLNGAGIALEDFEEEEDGTDKKKSKVKTKKRELSRNDLVDYDSKGFKKFGKGSGKIEKRSNYLPYDKNYDSGSNENKIIKVGKKTLKIGEMITVGELARQMSLKSSELISKLIGLGIFATINQAIDKDTATIIADEYGFEMESTSFDESEFLVQDSKDEPEMLLPRPPVVTVMGHVDHGKTSLLDFIRKAAVANKEHGGITQHIGAYSVTLEDGREITFIDTPGHAAFTSMRARGAQVTDVVILVVAVDDGVMPQTIEAINHAKAANVPMIVAINKMDKPGVTTDKIKQQLVEHGLQPEDWGGDTMFFPVSALKGTGISELLEGVLLVAEIKELKANPNKRARGAIIEARQDRGRGTVATVLVQAGTLKVGDVFIAGSGYGKVRSMLDHTGVKMESAGPSVPVEITGIDGMPTAGDDFVVVESDSRARQIASNRSEKIAVEERALLAGPISLEEFSRQAKSAPAQELNVIIKADVHGSLEAVRDSVQKLSTEKVKVKVVHAAVGGVNESDVQLALASRAIIVAFGVRGEPRALTDAENSGIEIRFYRIIYELLDDVRNAMSGLLAPIKEEVYLGRAEVRDTFVVSKVGTIAGSFVTDGLIKRGGYIRVVRDSKVVYEGKMGSLRRFKDDAKQVQNGYECGIGVENFNDVKIGDVLEVYEFKEVAQTL